MKLTAHTKNVLKSLRAIEGVNEYGLVNEGGAARFTFFDQRDGRDTEIVIDAGLKTGQITQMSIWPVGGDQRRIKGAANVARAVRELAHDGQAPRGAPGVSKSAVDAVWDELVHAVEDYEVHGDEYRTGSRDAWLEAFLLLQPDDRDKTLAMAKAQAQS
jgi:hypothetical protein